MTVSDQVATGSAVIVLKFKEVSVRLVFDIRLLRDMLSRAEEGETVEYVFKIDKEW